MSLEQQRIIESDARHIFVAAAAGSGKTRVLVQRYLRFVRNGISPDRMLTITFTKKAAAEMKQRIVAALTAEGLDREAQAAETGPIQTLHSFCERVLRENALEAGIDPRFEIMDGRAKASLVERCVAEAIAGCLEDEDPLVEALVERLAGLSRFRDRDPHGKLKGVVRDLIGKFRGSEVRIEHLLAMARSPEALLQQWQEVILKSVPEHVKAQVTPGMEFAERLKSAYGDAKKPTWLGGEDTMADAENTCAVMRLAASTWQRMNAEMMRTARVDFTLLEQLAVDLTQRSTSVQERLRAQFDAVFVDEGQDLNPLQYQLVAALLTQHFMLVGDVNQSIYSFRLADPELFRHHPDRHQAQRFEITRNWRSDAGILAFVDAVFETRWTEYRRMAERPDVSVLDDLPPLSMEGVEVWLAPNPAEMQVAEAVKDLIESGVRPGDICVLCRRTQSAILIQRDLEHQKVRSRIVGGNDRYFTRLEVRDLANALRALVNPADDFALLATLRSPFAGISMDALILLAKPQPEGPPHGIDRLRSTPLSEADRATVDQFLSWFEPLGAYADRLSAHEAIAELFARSPFLPRLLRRHNGTQAYANARKLLTMAAAEPTLSPEAFANQVQETSSLRHQEAEAEAHDGEEYVSLTTIHKAKGLEYPVVVVADIWKPFPQSKDGVVADPRLPMAVVQLHKGNKTSIYDRFLRELEHERQKDEEWRTTYVALTRAKHRLCVVCPTGQGKVSVGREIPRLLRLKPEEPPPGLRIRYLGG